MHRFTSPADLDGPLPRLEDFHFHDALDVIEYASLEGMFDWNTAAEVWHLDDSGTYRCGSRFSSFTNIRTLAEVPFILQESRRHGLADGGCPDRWLIHDYRPTRWGRKPPDEGDVQAFATVRSMLAGIGVHLLDCMVWSDQMQCWSLHELTSGTTRWAPRATAA